MNLLKNVFIAALFFVLYATSSSLAHAEYLYPDLLTLPPSDLQFDRVDINGSQKVVLRFTNTVWNAGHGPLEMYGRTTHDGQTEVTQRIHGDASESYKEEQAGHFIWHEAHNHWHFEKFAQYQLWTAEEFDEWVENGRNEEEAENVGYKTTFCIRETQLVENLPGSPTFPIHTQCGTDVQGLSVGWGDSYRYDLPEQWIEIGDELLSDGEYVLRSVADPENKIKESPDNDPGYESPDDNEAITRFTVSFNQITLD